MEEDFATCMGIPGDSESNAGWQKVVNSKRQRKPKQENSAGWETEVRPNGSGEDVFRSVEQHAEERRRRDLEARKAAIASAELLATHSGAAGGGDSSPDDDRDPENSRPNGVVEEKKPKQKKTKKPKITVPEASAKIDAADLSAFLADVLGSYENAPDIQLMRLADYYARVFSAVSASQFPWTKTFKESPVAKIIDVPLCYISEDVYKTSVDWINQRPAEALGEFVLWGLNSIISDLEAQQAPTKGSKKPVQQSSPKAQVAIFLVLALVLRRRPETLLNLEQTLKTKPEYQGQEKLPFLIWAVAQASQGDLAMGMSLWVQLLLPIAAGKSSNPHSRDLVLQLLERILGRPKARSILLNGAVRKGDRLVPPSALDLLMQAAFPIPSARIKATERFEAVYPLLKELALAGSPGSKAMKQVAQQLFPIALFLITKSNPEVSAEAADIFIWCLTQSSDNYKQWEKIHLQNIDASIFVLSKLSEEWNKYSPKLGPGDALRQTLKNLRVKNDQALSGGDSDADRLASIGLADKFCKTILGKLSSHGGCAKAGILALTIGITVYAVASANLNSLDWKKLLVLLGSPSPREFH